MQNRDNYSEIKCRMLVSRSGILFERNGIHLFRLNTEDILNEYKHLKRKGVCNYYIIRINSREFFIDEKQIEFACSNYRKSLSEPIAVEIPIYSRKALCSVSKDFRVKSKYVRAVQNYLLEFVLNLFNVNLKYVGEVYGEVA